MPMIQKFVSRAGQKLQHALNTFKIDVSGKVCTDLGCSTGGFVDCLLQNGAAKVYAVDTGYGVLEWKLRQNKQVVTLERTNALHIQLPEKIDFISIDVGWTRQKLIVPHALELLKDDGDIVSLLKPHYEAEKSWLRKGKLQSEFLDRTVEKVRQDLLKSGIKIRDISESPIVGEKGKNIEYVMWIKKND